MLLINTLQGTIDLDRVAKVAINIGTITHDMKYEVEVSYRDTVYSTGSKYLHYLTGDQIILINHLLLERKAV